MDYIYNPYTTELYHYGVKGMKWGVRRYQNKDGSLTNAGRRRERNESYKKAHDSFQRDLKKLQSEGRGNDTKAVIKRSAQYDAERNAAKAKYKQAKEADKNAKKDMRDASKNRRTLSDAELDARIKRLEKEKRLRELTDGEINRGRNAVNSVLAESGKKVAKTVVAGAAMYAVKYAITKEFDAKDAAAYIVPKPKTK